MMRASRVSSWFFAAVLCVALPATGGTGGEPPGAVPVAAETQAKEASPYRWFVLVGFVAGGLFTLWRVRSRARVLRSQRDDALR